MLNSHVILSQEIDTENLSSMPSISPGIKKENQDLNLDSLALQFMFLTSTSLHQSLLYLRWWFGHYVSTLLRPPSFMPRTDSEWWNFSIL